MSEKKPTAISSRTSNFEVCPGCDLLITKIQPKPGHTAACPRCSRRLHREHPNTVQRSLALSATGMLLFLPANLYPLLSFNVMGTKAESSLFHATLSMFAQGENLVGFIVLLTGFIFPMLTLSLLFWVSAGLFMGWKARWMTDFMRWYQHLTEWSMNDVYLIGVFITIIKMSHMATIHFDVGFFCFLGLVLVTISSQASVDKSFFWQEMSGDREEEDTGEAFTVSIHAKTGQEGGLVLCHTCHKAMLSTELARESHPHCPRCGEAIHPRKNGSISRSWALVVTAAILTVPANLLPIMEVEYFGQPDASTILDGIIYFFQEGSYGIGAVILTASILVPVFKITGMALILTSIHFRWQSWLKHKTLMFRFIEFVGRWSMLDIFVIALLCALVQFGYLSTINTAPAAFYFTLVVLCTMFAAISFDSRLIWDE